MNHIIASITSNGTKLVRPNDKHLIAEKENKIYIDLQTRRFFCSTAKEEEIIVNCIHCSNRTTLVHPKEGNSIAEKEEKYNYLQERRKKRISIVKEIGDNSNPLLRWN